MRCITPGDVVGDKYRLVTELARGGMGTVWHARHLRLNCSIALKLIDPVVALTPHALQRFLCEARIAAALRGPHVVQILDYGVDEVTPYIAMEMLDGESLDRRLLRLGRLSCHETARVIRHVSRALSRAHGAGVVHRDLKPENIFVIPNGDATLIKVLDFGIAKANVAGLHAPATLTTREGELMGTPHFMSPEQAEGLNSVDYRADIWALGVLAFECLLGSLPFKGDNVPSVILAICRDPMPVPSETGPVPAGFDAWFARACARDPQQRFESAKQAAEEFERWDSVAPAASASDGLAEPVDPESARAATRRPPVDAPSGAPPLERPSSRVGVGLLGGAILLLLAAAWVGQYWGGRGPRAEAVSSPARPRRAFPEVHSPKLLAAEPPGTWMPTAPVPADNPPGLGRPADVTSRSENLEP
jgi:serine/threonine protein kinase